MHTSELLTIRGIARECGVPVHRAKYAAELYDIAPDQRAGIIRLWRAERVQEFKSAIRRISGRREVGAHG